MSTKGCDVIEIPDSEPGVKISTKTEKPKRFFYDHCFFPLLLHLNEWLSSEPFYMEINRRLLPASSLLLRDFSTLDIDDDEKPKVKTRLSPSLALSPPISLSGYIMMHC